MVDGLRFYDAFRTFSMFLIAGFIIFVNSLIHYE